MKRLLIVLTAALAFTAAPEARADARTGCDSKPSEALVTALVKESRGMRPEVLRMALNASGCATKRGLVKRPEILTVIDYSLPSDQPRLWVFNVASRKLLFRELVAHGKNSGDNLTKHFSNVNGSLATSLGLFVTAGTYMGSNGYSLRMKGLEPGVNDKAWERAIVMHGASYVNYAVTRALGRLGRSWGCPAVRTEVARKMIDTVKGGSPIFAYYPEKKWLATSAFLSRSTKVADASTGANTAR